jgi:hypothetical protein
LFVSELLVSRKQLTPFDSEYAYCDEFVPAERSESRKNPASLNKSMAGPGYFVRDELLLKYF